jgi:hypothetical protein
VVDAENMVPMQGKHETASKPKLTRLTSMLNACHRVRVFFGSGERAPLVEVDKLVYI